MATNRKFLKVLMSTMAAGGAFALAAPASAAPNWEGTADYKAAPTAAGDEDKVGPFDRYDFGVGAVLLEPTSQTTFDGFYQSFVTNQQLGGLIASAAGLNTNYELTAVASFSETLTSPSTFTLNPGGKFDLYFDTTPDRDFNADSGFNDDVSILQGEIVQGSGAIFTDPNGTNHGFSTLNVKVTGYNQDVFAPDTIRSGSSIFTLSFNKPEEDGLLAGIASVQGHSFDAAAGDRLATADGNLVMQVPEPETYAMMLAGLGLVGAVAARRKRS